MSLMTWSRDRTRSLCKAAEFLQECQAWQEQTLIDLWRWLEDILENFPTVDEVRNLAENGREMGFGVWCRPENQDPEKKGW
jgi:hypothetical protein